MLVNYRDKFKFKLSFVLEGRVLAQVVIRWAVTA